MLAIGLAWITLNYLDGRQRDYEERVVGALKFLDATIDAFPDLDADLYAPSIKPQPEPNRWVISGILVIRDGEAEQARLGKHRRPVSASLESVCLNHGDPACWQLEELEVDGSAIITSEPASSDHVSTAESDSVERAMGVSAPKEPSTRTPPEFPATPFVTAARPLEDMTVPLPARLPCVEQGAWTDPDIVRNRNIILNQAICLSVIEFAENGLNWRVQVLDSGRPGYNWVLLHDDEDTAFDSALYAIARHGGKAVDIDLQPPIPSRAFVDPNRNFAASVDQRRTCDGRRRRAAPLFTATIIEQLGTPPYLALHNNYDGHFRNGGNGNISVKHSTRGLFGLPAFDPIGRLADEDNFIVVSGLTPPRYPTVRMRQLTDELRNSGVNVIYEYVHEGTYDCSLSNYLMLYGGAEPGQYFNIEAEAGDYLSQITMINALVGTLVSPLSASR